MDWKKRKKRRKIARSARFEHYWEYKEHVKLFATGWLVHVPRKARKLVGPPDPETSAAIRKAEFDGMPLSKFNEQVKWWEGIQDKELQKYE